MQEQNEMMRRKQAALYLGITEVTFDRTVKRSRLPYVMIGTVKLFKKSDLDQFITDNTHNKHNGE